MIKEVELQNFKQLKDKSITFLSEGITILVGGNNSGKSTIIHALAIWEFAKLILSEEKGKDALLSGYTRQGVGISADEFLPIAIPSLNHLWTNLKTQKTEKDGDGYTLRIGCKWDTDSRSDCYLEIGLSLVNDRLFIKPTKSNLTDEDKIPNVAFMPTFAGILEKEPKVTFAERRKQMGKGLAGAVMRNMIYELYENNEKERTRLKDGKAKISSKDLKSLRENDPFERLQEMLRRIFSMELKVIPFNDLYNTNVKVLCYKVKWNNETNRYKKLENYNDRDIMSQGNGFLQWLTIFPLALNSHVDVLLLDEPDAHLHNVLQRELLNTLETLIPNAKKQIIFATHSTRIIKESIYSRVFNMNKMKYLSSDEQKISVLLGLGGEYLPYVDKAKITKMVLFLEGSSDYTLLEKWAKHLMIKLPELCYILGTELHKERYHIFQFLKTQIPKIKAISLRDRDTHHSNEVKTDLSDSQKFSDKDYLPLTWKRKNHENYLLFPDAIARATRSYTKTEIENYFTKTISTPDLETFKRHATSPSLLDVDGKTIMENIKIEFGCSKFDVADSFLKHEIPDDIKTLFARIQEFFNLSP